MKKFTSIFAIVLALVVCLGAMTACTGGKEDESKNPAASTPAGDKNESKPEGDKNESKPEEDKNEGSTESKPEGDKNEGTTESKPEEDKNESTGN
jgi:hypothetical protein